MSLLLAIRFVHLVAAATWVGGNIVLAPIVVTLRRANADPELIRAAARTFARVAWTALAIAVVTGLAQVAILHLPLTWGPLQLKIAAVSTTVVVAAIHQATAARSGPRLRRGLEVLVLLATLAVVAAAVRL